MVQTAELTSESTHEDIQDYVNSVVQDMETAREDDNTQNTSDAEKVASDTPETRTVEDSDSDAVTDSDETTGNDQASADWLDDDLKAEVAAYGIDDHEVADFSSREELERALRVFDKAALTTGRKALKDSAAGNDEPQPKDGASDASFEVSLDSELYDEEIIAEFTRMRDHYESRLGALEQMMANAEARAEEQVFDNIVDSLGHADLFGKTGKETGPQHQRREDLLVAARAQQLGLQQMGRDVELDESLVSRVAKMVFADELAKKELKSRTRRISEQSKARQGGGATRQSDQPESLQDEMRRLYKELEQS
tara:strand:- start:3633 stop:4562 length:930 start_codon:yes stop_codon:yes gene_type:complete